MESDSGNPMFEGKGKLYFVLALIFLLTLSLLWSVDKSIAYLLTGANIIFFFLAITNLNPTTFKKSQNHWDFTPSDKNDNPFKNFNQKFSKGNIYSPPGKDDSSNNILRKVGFITGIIIIFFVGLIVTDALSDNEPEAEIYFQQGEAFYDAYQYDSAQNFYRKAIQLNAEYPEAITGYGNTLMMQENYDSALIMYDKALIINPQYSNATYQRSLVLYYLKSYDESVATLKTLLNEDPSYYSAMQLMGDNFYVRDQYDSALYWYKGAYSNNVRNRYLCHLMGYIYQTKDSADKAIQLYQEALSYDSTVTDIYERLGALMPGPQGEWYRKRALTLQSN